MNKCAEVAVNGDQLGLQQYAGFKKGQIHQSITNTQKLKNNMFIIETYDCLLHASCLSMISVFSISQLFKLSKYFGH